ncbi:hypothetical protein NP493_15g04024 [Ridgeia piscesae]|uniref:Transmembrane protein 214 n=1 Tax=Ridgeia piscesae TaxID=27915 RepID=A0AAD9UKX9_RIDPI|nr:hypothetical protein NP493_15g04024 [Ridgeia piscesae]
MATPGHWEVVGKPAKKTTSQHGSKIPKKTPGTSLPRLEHQSPSPEDPTIYGAFLAKEKKEQQRQQQVVETLEASTKPHNDTSSPKKTRVIKKSNLPEKKKERPLNLDEAISKIEVQELQQALATSQERFPENKPIWLKDLVSVLNLGLEKVTMIDPTFEDESPEYPSCQLPKKMRSLLLGQLRECPREMLQLFLEHCVQEMVSTITRGGSTFGYCIFIQLVFSLKPDLASDSLPKYLDMLRHNQKRPLPCLSIMWALGQAGTHNLACGLKVWQQLMVPVLNIRALASYGVLYLDSLFRRHPKLDNAYGVFTFHDFFPIFDLIFSQKFGLPGTQQKMLQSLYPKLKLICFGDNRQNNLHKFFPSFLDRCLPSNSHNMQAEMLDCLMTCLIEDPQSFSRWQQMYTNHMVQTSLLLEHMLKHWDGMTRRLDRQRLSQLVHTFSSTNTELAASEGINIDGYQRCVTACKQLEKKMSSARFPWRLTLLMIMCLFGSVIYYDIFTHGSFEKSKTHSILSDTGALVFLQKAWKHISFYTELTVAWLVKNVPIYYEKASVFAAPYLELMWQKLVLLGLFAAKQTENTRTWLNENIPVLLHWLEVNVPIFLNACGVYLNMLWELLIYLAQQVIVGINFTIVWLQENIFVGSLSMENIQKTLVETLMSVRGYSVRMFEWVKHAISNGSKS